MDPTPTAGTPLATKPLTANLRTAYETLTAYEIGLQSMRTKVQDYYDESLNLKDLTGATYWNAYLGGIQAAKQLLDKLQSGEI